jgi:hypothetical protein
VELWADQTEEVPCLRPGWAKLAAAHVCKWMISAQPAHMFTCLRTVLISTPLQKVCQLHLDCIFPVCPEFLLYKTHSRCSCHMIYSAAPGGGQVRIMIPILQTPKQAWELRCWKPSKLTQCSRGKAKLELWSQGPTPLSGSLFFLFFLQRLRMVAD